MDVRKARSYFRPEMFPHLHERRRCCVDSSIKKIERVRSVYYAIEPPTYINAK